MLCLPNLKNFSLHQYLSSNNSLLNTSNYLTSTLNPTHPANVVSVTGIPAHHLHEGLAKSGDGGEVLFAQLLVLRVFAGQYALHTLHI